MAQMGKKDDEGTRGLALTRSRSPSPAATQMFFCWRVILDERWSRLEMMGDDRES